MIKPIIPATAPLVAPKQIEKPQSKSESNNSFFNAMQRAIDKSDVPNQTPKTKESKPTDKKATQELDIVLDSSNEITANINLLLVNQENPENSVANVFSDETQKKDVKSALPVPLCNLVAQKADVDINKAQILPIDSNAIKTEKVDTQTPLMLSKNPTETLSPAPNKNQVLAEQNPPIQKLDLTTQNEIHKNPEKIQTKAETKLFSELIANEPVPVKSNQITTKTEISQPKILPDVVLEKIDDIKNSDKKVISTTNPKIDLTNSQSSGLKVETLQPQLQKNDTDLNKLDFDKLNTKAYDEQIAEKSNETFLNQKPLKPIGNVAPEKEKSQQNDFISLKPADIANEPVILETNSFLKNDVTSNDIQKTPKMQIAQNVKANLIEGKKEFLMELNPQSLGKVQVKLSIEDGLLTVSIQAQNPKTQSLLLSQVNEIKELVQNATQTFANVVATPQQNETSQNYQQQQNQNQKDAEQNNTQQQKQDQQTTSTVDFLSLLQNIKSQIQTR